MKVSIALNNFAKLYDQLFSKRDNDLLTDDGINYLTIFSSVITIHGFIRFQSKFAWSKLFLIILKSVACFAIQILSLLIFRQKIVNGSKGDLLIVCNTSLAFREIYSPLISSSDLLNIQILFTNNKVKTICIEAALKLGCIVISNANENALEGVMRLIKVLIVHLKYIFYMKDSHQPFFLEKLYLTNYSFFSSLQRLFYVFRYLPQINKGDYFSVVSDDVNDPCVRYIIEYCKLKDVKTSILQFGHYDIDSIEWKFVNSSRVYAWGNYYKNLFLTLYINKKIDIRVIGSPRFDYLFTTDLAAATDGTRKIIIVLSTYSIDNYSQISDASAVATLKAQVAEDLLEYADAHNASVIIKPHPYESDSDLSIWNKFHSKNFKILNKDFDIRVLFRSTDVIVSFGTGLTIDCLVAGIPVLLPSWNNFPWEYGALVHAGAAELNARKELIEMLLHFEDRVKLMHIEGVIKDFVAQNSAVSRALIKDFMAGMPNKKMSPKLEFEA